MKKAAVNRDCCLDERGQVLPMHLCCPFCRADLAAVERAALLAAGAAPGACSGEIINAPARGPLGVYSEVLHLPDGDGVKVVEAPYRAGAPGKSRDVFDTMTDQATRRGGQPPFTASQVAAGRTYHDLVERVATFGVKCSRVFDDSPRGNGRGPDPLDAYRRDVRRLEAFRIAIGQGTAKASSRAVDVIARGKAGAAVVGTAQLRDIGKRLITTRALVDAVCIDDKPLSAVLRVHGWREGGKNQITLREALRAALWRMEGL